MPEISFLLGAGFSIPKGYPSARELNISIKEFDVNAWHIGSAYELVSIKNVQDHYSPNNHLKHFLRKMIDFFSKHFEFDYEEFYDFLIEPEKYKGLGGALKEQYQLWGLTSERLSSYCYQTLIVYNKLVPFYIKDRNGVSQYPVIGYGRGTLSPHNSFLEILEKIGSEYDTIHIHTLNHDLVAESFKSSEYLNGDLSDGFEELASPFYGTLKDWENHLSYPVRLRYFTNVFTGKYRLYKLHGSIDQVPVRNKEGYIAGYVKTLPKIGFTDINQELIIGTEVKYYRDWLNHHADFLSGTTSKILRYKEPFYYGRVFDHFERNLLNSDRIIIIGYGARDSEINNILIRNSRFQARPTLIFEPYPTSATMALKKSLAGRVVPNSVEKMNVQDLTNSWYVKTLKK